MSLDLDLPDFPYGWIQIVPFWQEFYSNDAMFSLYPIRWHTISVCVIAETHFDHLIKVKSPRLLYYEVPPPPLVIK